MNLAILKWGAMFETSLWELGPTYKETYFILKCWVCPLLFILGTDFVVVVVILEILKKFPFCSNSPRIFASPCSNGENCKTFFTKQLGQFWKTKSFPSKSSSFASPKVHSVLCHTRFFEGTLYATAFYLLAFHAPKLC